MQQRRGTAAQWTSANPILNAGEMGWESDTNKFKIGDGTNHWADLDYFADINSTINPAFGTSIIFEGATADSYETTLQVTDPTADRTITLPNVSGTVITTGNLSDITDIGVFTSTITMEGSTADSYELTLSAGDPTADRTITFPDATGTVALTSDIAELSQDAINDALTAGTGITKTYNDSANTLTLAVDTTTIQARVADVSDTEIGYLNGVTSAIQTQLDAKSTESKTETLTNKSISLASNTLTGTTSEFNSALSDSNFVTTGDTGTVTSTMIADGTIVNGDISASAAIDKTKISGTAVTAADTGTVTSTMIADGTIVDGDINASAAIAQSKISNLTTDLGSKLSLSGGTMTGAIAMGTSKITGLGSPTADADAATKAYVDAATAGLNVHASVQAATTANITLASAVENGDTLDGVTLATGNRILVKNQTDKTENGVYVVAASGAPSRATDYDSTPEVDAGDFIFVEAGTVNGKTGWTQTNVITAIGSDNIEFTQFSGAGTYSAGTGLTLTGTTFSINTGTTVDLNTAQTLTNKTVNLTSNTLSGTTAQFNTALSDGDFATLAGSETLTNKTINGSNNTITNVSLTSGVTGTLPVANGGTGITSLGTGIATFLGTPSSANLASAITDETGSGALVFANTPTLVTPNIGAATGTSLTTTGGGVLARAASTQDGVEIRGRAGGTGNWEVILTPTTLTADRTLTLPDATGTVSLLDNTETLSNKTLASAVATTAFTLNATAELRLADTDSSHYVGFKAPGTVSTNRIWTLPSADGTSGQVLSTNGSGTLSWSTAGGGGASFSELMLIGA